MALVTLLRIIIVVLLLQNERVSVNVSNVINVLYYINADFAFLTQRQSC